MDTEETLAGLLIDAETLGLVFMGDQMIGFKFVDGTPECRRRWNLVLQKFIPEGFVFTDEFFDRHGISPAPFESQRWIEHEQD